MNFHQPWIMDIRQSQSRDRFAKSGFPKVKSSRFIKYRVFTIQCIVLMVLLLSCTMLVYTRPLALIKQRQFSTIGQVDRSLYSHSTKRKGVIILTNHRSGSTFFGQFFNQRSDSFYFYEPLVALDSHCQKEHERKKVLLLHNLFRCNIQDQVKDVKGDPGEKNCLKNNFCFREKSKTLCTSLTCSKGDQATCRGCEPVNTTSARKLCNTRDVIAAKIIRLCDIRNLRPILEDPALDIKVLHLVRDPRGQLSSKDQLDQNENSKDSVAATCGSIQQNMEAGRSIKWLEDKYRIIRYEDLCQEPIRIAKSIYDFIGVDFTSNIKEWITSNTNGELDHLDSRGRNILNKFNKNFKNKLKSRLKNQQLLLETVLNDPYSTTRNSSANWRKWQNVLTFQEVSYVQSACESVLRTLNYKKLTSENQLKDYSIKLLDELTFTEDI